MNWELLGSNIVFDNYMQVEERTYRLPDGSVKKFYIKVNKPAVCVLAMTDDNQVILTEQFRPGPNATLLELPGGFIDDGEAPEQAVRRELLEETGYAGTIEFVTDCFDDAYTTMVRSCFVATNCTAAAAQDLDNGEFISVKLVPLDEFKQIVRSGRMTDVEVALLGLDHLRLLS